MCARILCIWTGALYTIPMPLRSSLLINIMAYFINALRVQKVASGDEDTEFVWELLEPLAYASALVPETLVVPKGFQTDFASVPRVPLAYLLTGDKVHAPAVVHDWLIRERIVHRTIADRIFLEAMECERIAWWRRRSMYLAVSVYTLWLDLTGRLPAPAR